MHTGEAWVHRAEHTPSVPTHQSSGKSAHPVYEGALGNGVGIAPDTVRAVNAQLHWVMTVQMSGNFVCPSPQQNILRVRYYCFPAMITVWAP